MKRKKEQQIVFEAADLVGELQNNTLEASAPEMVPELAQMEPQGHVELPKEPIIENLEPEVPMKIE